MNNQVLNNQERGIIFSQRTEMSTETGGYSDGPLDSHQTTCMRKPTPVKPRSHTVWNSPRRHLLAACFTTSMSCCFGTTVMAFEVWNNPTINVIFLCRYQTHTAWSPLLPPHIPQVRKWCGVTFACCYFVNVICGGFVSVLVFFFSIYNPCIFHRGGWAIRNQLTKRYSRPGKEAKKREIWGQCCVLEVGSETHWLEVMCAHSSSCSKCGVRCYQRLEITQS